MPSPDSLINKSSSIHYWQGIEATVDGMLGSFEQITHTDLQGSRNFLAKLGIGLKPGQRGVTAALEGGCGIGRITTSLLVPLCNTVDVIEPVEKFTHVLRTSCSSSPSPLRHIFSVGLQDWYPSAGAEYDLIWTQWCVGHLTDDELVVYLKRCRATLRRGDGVMVVKENLNTSGEDVYDEVDSSVTRQDEKFRRLFQEAGLRIVKTELQRGFPRALYPVRMYALKP